MSCFIRFNGNTFCVISHISMYYIFDSHSRNCNGHITSEGTGIMKCAPTWKDVHMYCTELANSMNIK